MRRAIAIVAVLLVVSIAGVLGFAATKPDTFRVQRATVIKAPPEKIAGFLNDFRRYRDWSPYEKMDPAMARTHSGAASGRGAVYAWESEGPPGIGRMEIADTSPSKVTIKLDFVKPFEAHNIVEFTLDGKGESTAVTWAMQGDVPYFAKIIHVFIDMDRMIGQDFEAGLANLKAVAES